MRSIVGQQTALAECFDDISKLLKPYHKDTSLSLCYEDDFRLKPIIAERKLFAAIKRLIFTFKASVSRAYIRRQVTFYPKAVLIGTFSEVTGPPRTEILRSTKVFLV